MTDQVIIHASFYRYNFIEKKSSFLCTDAATGSTTPTYLWSLHLIRCDFGSKNSLALQMMVANFFFHDFLYWTWCMKMQKRKLSCKDIVFEQDGVKISSLHQTQRDKGSLEDHSIPVPPKVAWKSSPLGSQAFVIHILLVRADVVLLKAILNVTID